MVRIGDARRRRQASAIDPSRASSPRTLAVVAVFGSTLLASLVQTRIALIGLAIAGVPELVLLTFLTFVASLAPAVRWWLAGHHGMAIFLLLWGAGPVRLSDDLLKPYLARGAGSLPASVRFFATISGIAVFGLMGIVAGPLVVAPFVVAVRVVRDEPASPRALRPVHAPENSP